MNKGYLTLAGFIMMGIGLLSLFFSLIGLNFTFLGYLYEIGRGFAFLVYILFVMIGGILVYVSKTNQN